MPDTIIYLGDSAQRLKQIPDEFVNCVVTSPPYFRLRTYSDTVWNGGDPNCRHSNFYRAKVPHSITVLSKSDLELHQKLGLSPAYKTNKYPLAIGKPIGNGTFVCSKCGAFRYDLQIGLEVTPKEYIDRLLGVFSEVKRVLRNDGVMFVNIGDSSAIPIDEKLSIGIKKKDLFGIPWLLAFALRDQGWYLREEIIWNKLTSIPDLHLDRPARKHERIFLFSKNADYWFDTFALNERDAGGQPKRCTTVWDMFTDNVPGTGAAPFPLELARRCILLGVGGKGVCADCGVPWNSNKGRGWRKTCTCIAERTMPGIVLDPFLGSGTTAIAANRLGHDCLGVELNALFAEKAAERVRNDDLVFPRSVSLE